MTDWLKISGNVGPQLTKPSRRWFLSRGGLALLAGTLVVVVFKLVDLTAELLWFREFGYEDVFWRLLFAEVAMFATAFIPVFVYVLLNLLVLARLVDLQSLLGGRSPAGIPQVERDGSPSPSRVPSPNGTQVPPQWNPRSPLPPCGASSLGSARDVWRGYGY